MTSVSLQTTTTSASTLEPCNNLISCRRNKKKKIFLKLIIEGVWILVEFLNRTPVHTVLSFRSVIFVFTVAQTLVLVITLWYILFKTCNVELRGRSTSFLSYHPFITVYLLRVINKPQQFHSHRTMWEYEPD